MFRLIVIFLCVFILHFFIVFYFFFLIGGKLGNAQTTKLKQISQVHSAQDVLLNFNSVSANNYIYIHIFPRCVCFNFNPVAHIYIQFKGNAGE